jgi:hypothetical protein
VTENNNTAAVIFMRSSIVCDNIDKNEMGRSCSSDGGGERHVQGFGGETDHWGYPGGDGTIILRRILKKLDVGV